MAKTKNNTSQPTKVLEADDMGQTSETIVSVGLQLKNAREAKSISVSEVTKKLNLTKTVIDNLEADAWDKLNGRTYVRGYLASYSNFLGLSAEPLLAQFDHSYEEEVQPLNVHRSHVKKRGFPWFKLIVIGLLALAVWFAYQQWPAIQEKFLTQVEVLTEEESTASDLEQIKTMQETSVENVATNKADAIASQGYPIEGKFLEREKVIEEEGSQVTMLKLPELSVDTTELEKEETINENATITSTESIEKVTLAEPNNPLQSTLALAFAGTCWVNVKDLTGKTLLNDTKQLGEHVVLTGNPPLRIVLGNASNVLVTFNGNSFNTQPFINNGGVARFTLDNKQP